MELGAMSREYHWNWKWDPKTKVLSSRKRKYVGVELIGEPFGKCKVFDLNPHERLYEEKFFVMDSECKELWDCRDLYKLELIKFNTGKEYLKVVLKSWDGGYSVVLDSDFNVVLRWKRENPVECWNYERDGDFATNWVKTESIAGGKKFLCTIYGPEFEDGIGPLDEYFWTGGDDGHYYMLAMCNNKKWSLMDWNTKEIIIKRVSKTKFKYALGIMHLNSSYFED